MPQDLGEGFLEKLLLIAPCRNQALERLRTEGLRLETTPTHSSSQTDLEKQMVQEPANQAYQNKEGKPFLVMSLNVLYCKNFVIL